MHFLKPSKMGIFQLVVICLLLATFFSPSEGRVGPMLKFKLKNWSGKGGIGAAYIIAARIAAKAIKEIHKHHQAGFGGYSLGGGRRGFSNGGGYGGYGMGGGYGGYGMGGGYGGYNMVGDTMGYTFESHSSKYGYEPLEITWAK